MPISVSGTSIVFNDSTTQTTAFTGSVPGVYSTIQQFTSPGTFTTPANVTRVQLVVMSGGGGGGGGASNRQGGLGGAGIVAAGIYPVSASTPYAVTVGGAGNGGGGSLFNGTAGGTGGSSSFGNVLTANGGGGGNAGNQSGSNGNTGNSGTAPLAQVSATVSPAAVNTSPNAGGGAAAGFALSSGVFGGFYGPSNPEGNEPGFPGNAGGAGKVLVYY
jgi:hypothetical protein